MSQGEGSREGGVRVHVRVGGGDDLVEGFREGGRRCEQTRAGSNQVGPPSAILFVKMNFEYSLY